VAQALVPLKDLVRAKSRLAGLLSPSERRALAQAMVEDVLAVLSVHPLISRVTLVSDDPGAGLLASQYGIDYWPESALGCRGLNAVLACASARLLADRDETLVVLHGDLPLLGSAEMSAVLHRQRQLGGLVVGCDRQGVGTNLLAFDRACVPRFQFGQGSCQRHLAGARAAGLKTAVLRLPGIALDVDDPDDLAALFATTQFVRADRCGAICTSGLLQGSPLGARIRLALASLHPADGLSNEEQTS